MAFDGRRYPGPIMIPPRAYQPGAPASADPWHSILSNAYYSVRNENLMAYQVYLPVENANRSADYPGTVNYPKMYDGVYSGSTWHKLASAYKYVPSVATHVYALAVFEIYAVPFSAASYQVAHFRFNGDAGASSSFDVEANNKFPNIYIGPSRFVKEDEIQMATCSLRAAASSVITTGAETWVDVDCYARGLIIPHAVLIWWGIEDA